MPATLASGSEAERSPQHAQDDVLDLADVIGKRLIDTRLKPKITIREANAIAAPEVMSRFAIDPKWLIYLPPTMSPTETSKHPDLLEHPDEAFAFYRKEGIATVICEQKHMGSRAVVVLCREESVSQARFGVVKPSIGIVYTRTGRRFFSDEVLEQRFLNRLSQAAERAGLWQELGTDWMCLDCELMPWSDKAQELLRNQYAPVGNAGVHGLAAEQEILADAMQRLEGLGELADRTRNRAEAVGRYVRAYRQYCWTANSLEDLKLAPFHLLATEGVVHSDNPHTWHMDMIAKLCASGEELLITIPFQLVDLQDEQSCSAATDWWTAMTAQGREGMVVSRSTSLRKDAGGRRSQPLSVAGPSTAHHLRSRVPTAAEFGAVAIQERRRQAFTSQPRVRTWDRVAGALRTQGAATPDTRMRLWSFWLWRMNPSTLDCEKFECARSSAYRSHFGIA